MHMYNIFLLAGYALQIIYTHGVTSSMTTFNTFCNGSFDNFGCFATSITTGVFSTFALAVGFHLVKSVGRLVN